MSDSLQSSLNKLCLEPDDAGVRSAYRQKQRSVFRPEQRAQLLDAPSSAIGLKLSLGGKSDPAETMRACEDLLQKNPFDVSVLFRLGEAARRGGCRAAAVYVFGDIVSLCKGNPRLAKIERAAMKALGLSHYEALDLKNAQRVLDAYVQRYGLEEEADDFRKLVEKDLPARIAAIPYEEAGHARDVVRRPEETDRLAQEERGLHSPEERMARVAELEKLVGAPERKPHEKYRAAMDAAALCREMKDYDRALRLMELASGFDRTSQTEVAIAQLLIARATHELSALKAEADADPANEALKARLAEGERRKWALVVERFGSLANKVPNEEEFQLTLGEGRLNLGILAGDQEQVKAAISQFQKKYTKEEHVRKAAVLLGKAFARLGLIDLAKRQFQRILGSVDSDDPAKREIAFRALFELAQVQLEAGDNRGAFESLSEIYFRDRSWGNVEEQFLGLNRELAGKG